MTDRSSLMKDFLTPLPSQKKDYTTNPLISGLKSFINAYQTAQYNKQILAQEEFNARLKERELNIAELREKAEIIRSQKTLDIEQQRLKLAQAKAEEEKTGGIGLAKLWASRVKQLGIMPNLDIENVKGEDADFYKNLIDYDQDMKKIRAGKAEKTEKEPTLYETETKKHNLKKDIEEEIQTKIDTEENTINKIIPKNIELLLTSNPTTANKIQKIITDTKKAPSYSPSAVLINFQDVLKKKESSGLKDTIMQYADKERKAINRMDSLNTAKSNVDLSNYGFTEQTTTEPLRPADVPKDFTWSPQLQTWVNVITGQKYVR